VPYFILVKLFETIGGVKMSVQLNEQDFGMLICVVNLVISRYALLQTYSFSVAKLVEMWWDNNIMLNCI
jgi:hypothetical protein